MSAKKKPDMPTKPTKRRAGKREKASKHEYGYLVSPGHSTRILNDTSNDRWVVSLSHEAATQEAAKRGVDMIFRLVPVPVVKARRSK